MSASQAAVGAAMDKMNCVRSRRPRIISDPNLTGRFWCVTHELGVGDRADWTARGCAVAASIADAAVDADRTIVAVETLRQLAELIAPFSGIGLANGATRADIAQWISNRADVGARAAINEEDE